MLLSDAKFKNFAFLCSKSKLFALQDETDDMITLLSLTIPVIGVNSVINKFWKF